MTAGTHGTADVGSIDPLQARFGTPARIAGWPAAPTLRYNAPSQYLQEAVPQGHFSFTPQGDLISSPDNFTFFP